MFSFLAKSNVIRLVPLNLGSRTVRIPVADIAGKTPGKTLLVTAGIDGDEYAGMEAAYALIEAHKDGDFAGRLVVIPIVNVPGFEGEMSRNPMDGKFPKYIFPGSSSGSATDRLVAWLVKSYATKADLWYDLHGGAITEGLEPFLWTYPTEIETTDAMLNRIEQEAGAPLIVAERANGSSKAGQLARHGCAYAIAECGQRGERHGDVVVRHLAWAHGAMRALDLLPSSTSQIHSRRFTRVEYVYAPFDGIWRMSDIDTSVLGHCVRLDGTGMQELKALPGERLWWKETMSMKKGDVLGAFGS